MYVHRLIPQWHSLSREEQAKYYEKARAERQRHMQMYPHWNARDNYRFGLKKKKRKREKADDPGKRRRLAELTTLSLLRLLQWHGLTREEQAKYYEMAKVERQEHMRRHPGWSARDNYAKQKKKARRSREIAGGGGSNGGGNGNGNGGVRDSNLAGGAGGGSSKERVETSVVHNNQCLAKCLSNAFKFSNLTEQLLPLLLWLAGVYRCCN